MAHLTVDPRNPTTPRDSYAAFARIDAEYGDEERVFHFAAGAQCRAADLGYSVHNRTLPRECARSADLGGYTLALAID
jgi:hypothetical protein